MSRRNSIILGLLFVILVVEIIIMAPKEVGVQPEPLPSASTKATGDATSGEIMHGVHSVGATAQGKEWELWADRAIRTKASQDLSIERVKVKFFASSGVTYMVTGRKGKVVPTPDARISDIKIEGNVITRSSNGHVFKTETMFYDSKTRKLSSPQSVEMTAPPDKNGGEMVLTGGEMFADLGTNEITILKNVKAKKKIKDGKTAQINSDRALFSGRNKMAQFFGNVVVDVDTMRITGPEAQFAYDPKMEALESVLVGGGIRVTDTDKFATSRSVSVNFKDDRVVFNGAPRVVQNGDELMGDEIVLLDGGRKVQVSNARAQLDPKSMDGKSISAEKKN